MPSRKSSRGGDEESLTPTAQPSSFSKAMAVHEEPTERTPLCGDHDRERRVSAGLQRPLPWKSRETATLLVMLVIILISCGDQLMQSPQSRIAESVICYRYYEATDRSKLLVGRDAVGAGAIGGVAEVWCKADTVQEELALLRGYQQLLDGIPTLLLAVPFGWAADRYGRKPFLLLNLASITLQVLWIQFVTWYWQAFDIRMTWFSTLFSLFGAGSITATTLSFVIISDVTSEAQRAAVFFRLGAVNILASVLMPPLSAWLMVINPWIPTLGGTALMILGINACSFLPETLEYHGPHIHSSASGREGSPASPSLGHVSPGVQGYWLNCWLGHIRDATSFLTNDWRVPALILCFLCHTLVGTVAPLLLQYVSKRYALTFSEGTLLLTISNAVKMLLLYALLPYVSTAAIRWFRLNNRNKDLYLARASQLLLIVGWTTVGLAPNIPTAAVGLAVTALGQGTYLLVRSFLTSLVEAHHIARAYSLISIIDTLGSMFGGALLAGLFKRGLAMGGAWVGLPFFVLAIVLLAFLFVMFAVRLRKGEGEHVDEDEGEGEGGAVDNAAVTDEQRE